METFLNGKVNLIVADVREGLKILPDESVHCVVTSPPYWGLRDYGVDGQLGMESSLGEHVQTMVEVFREVRRVLRKDGTLWLNYGDSYAAAPNGRAAVDIVNDDRTFRDKPFSTIGPIYDPTPSGAGGSYESERPGWTVDRGRIRSGGYLKPKDLCGIPWRVALALQEDGWWLRSDIIWHKINPMPESVNDRPTKAHEYLFLMTQAERYYYDAEAILEPVSSNTHARLSQNVAAQVESARANGGTKTNGNMKAVGRTPKTQPAGKGIKNNDSFAAACSMPVTHRNKRTVWSIATEAFSEAHFATFPPALIEPCILAGCPEGGTVLDPFGGSGTTGLVAASLGRKCTLIELNPEYAKLARARIESAFMGEDEGRRHMVKQTGRLSLDAGPLFNTTP